MLAFFLCTLKECNFSKLKCCLTCAKCAWESNCCDAFCLLRHEVYVAFKVKFKLTFFDGYNIAC